MKNLFYLTTTAMLMVGCGAKKSPDVSKEMSSHMPTWAVTPPVGCAVGAYVIKGNQAMARQASTARARDELARQLDVKVKSMIKDYIEEGETNGEDFTEEITTSVSKQVASMSLSGTVAKKNDIMNDHFYTLVCLDTKTFIDAFDNMGQLSEKARRGLRKRAESNFRDLDTEVDRLENH